MKTVKHTPGPWSIGSGSHVSGMWSGMIRIESLEDFHSNGVDYPDGSTKSYTNVVCGTTGHSDTARANMLRIVECVNALAGVEDPAAAIREAREALQEAIHTHEVQMEMFPPNEVGHGVVRGSWLNTPDKLRSALAKLGGASC